MEMKVAVVLSEAKDLQFRSEASECRFFAALRMTNFHERLSGERSEESRAEHVAGSSRFLVGCGSSE
jgi:hypothetical protein